MVFKSNLMEIVSVTTYLLHLPKIGLTFRRKKKDFQVKF